MSQISLGEELLTSFQAVAFFETVVNLFQVNALSFCPRICTELFKQYEIYTALQTAGITPSTTATYNLADLQNAIITAYGVGLCHVRPDYY